MDKARQVKGIDLCCRMYFWAALDLLISFSTLFQQITVCLQCDLDSEQRFLFAKEAMILASVRHENIIELFGAVTLGCCAQSVALVSWVGWGV